MRIAPIDIVNKKFSRALRGLHPSEVADFQTETAATLEELLVENAHLRESVESLNQQVAKYSRIEETLQNTLLLAQRAAEEARRQAKQEAELTVREAQQKARELLEQAQARVREIEAEVARLRRERDRFAAEFSAMLQGYLTALNGFPSESEGETHFSPSSADLSLSDRNRPRSERAFPDGRERTISSQRPLSSDEGHRHSSRDLLDEGAKTLPPCPPEGTSTATPPPAVS